MFQRLVDVVCHLAQQELPFRGHDESQTSLNKGNLLELVSLLSKYDLVFKFTKTVKHIFGVESMMNIVLILCHFLCLSVMADECPSIMAWHGNFVVNGDVTPCDAFINGMKMNATDLPTIRAYGLLHVRRPTCVIDIVSAFGTCDDCAICAHNEGVLKCRSLSIPIALSIVITVLFCAIAIPSLLWLDSKCHFIHQIVLCLKHRKEAKTAKRAKRIKPLIEMELLKHGRTKLETGGEEPLHEETTKPRSRRPSPTPSMVLTALLLATGQAKACDDVLMMSSNGLISYNHTIISANTGVFAIHTGGSICLKYQDGSQESIKLTGISKMVEYTSLYRACSFNISTISMYNCAWAGECWDESTCHYGYKKKELLGDGKENPNEQFDCAMVPNSSPSHCTHEQICIWFKWAIVPDYNVCDGILVKTSTVTTLDIEYTSKTGNILNFKLSPSAPQVLEQHMQQSVKSGPSYLSKQIQNVIIHSVADFIKSRVEYEIDLTQFVSIIIDETPNVSKREQLCAILRYYSDNEIHDRFLGFIDV